LWKIRSPEKRVRRRDSDKELFELYESWFEKSLKQEFFEKNKKFNTMAAKAKLIMELHTIQNLIIHKSSHLQLIFAVILILK